MTLPEVHLQYPDWVARSVDWNAVYPDDSAKMALAVELSRLNVAHGTGGPFGAAVFEQPTGRLVSVGINLVVAGNNCTLHGEMVAFMMAGARVGSYSLSVVPGGPFELFTSCEPCAMCLGATLWSGVGRLVTAATRDDAMRLDFDEGPVFPESYAYLAERGIEIVRGVMRAEAAAVLEQYAAGAGVIYNGKEQR